jgi:hypothetical protein
LFYLPWFDEPPLGRLRVRFPTVDRRMSHIRTERVHDGTPGAVKPLAGLVRESRDPVAAALKLRCKAASSGGLNAATRWRL